jgi:4-hydroxymandelate oxidase
MLANEPTFVFTVGAPLDNLWHKLRGRSQIERMSMSRRRLMGSLASLPVAMQSHLVPAQDATPPANVMEYEALARAALPPAHFAYLNGGTDDNRTVAINHEAFAHFQIRARRFVDVSTTDMAIKVFGAAWATPIYLSAIGGTRAFHPEGEVAVARAAAAKSANYMLSTAASFSVEDVTKARDAPVWHQLYATDDWKVTEGIVKRAENAGCPAVVLTVDSNGARNNETMARAMREDTRDCTVCHINNSHDFVRKAPIFAGLDVSKVRAASPLNITWDFLARLRKLVKVKLLVKGIVTAEDAAHCLEHGIDGIVISNHGGRTEETLRSTIDCLPEIVAAVKARVPIFLDGGVRRGTDVFKALALGATGVGIGRPYGWALAAAGQKGVEDVLTILTRELAAMMRQAGTPDIRSIDSSRVLRS